jgi:hypothetical protein
LRIVTLETKKFALRLALAAGCVGVLIVGLLAAETTDGIPPTRVIDAGRYTGPFTARSWQSGGVNALSGDGFVRFVKTTVDGNTWRALGSIRGGEVVGGDQY